MAQKIDDQQEDRMKKLKAFDETNAGVKGLTDSGLLSKVPDIFIRPSHELSQESNFKKAQIRIPVIDISNIQNTERREKILEEVKIASETWGFFQVVNHGIPTAVIDGMIDGVSKFNNMDVEEKRKYYSRDTKRNVRYNSSYDLYTSKTASWKDTLVISFSGPDPTDPQELPASCRESSVEYSKHVKILGNILLGLLSEALGLETDHLEKMECSKGHRIQCHYYPACPEPQLAIGTDKHSDPGFITILMQSQNITALQVFYEEQWVDIKPTPEGLIVNIGDLLQLVSNGKVKSSTHRANVSHIGPRISVACFFSGPVYKPEFIYGPIKEMITDQNPPMYKDVVLGPYFDKLFSTGLDNYRALDYYKL